MQARTAPQMCVSGIVHDPWMPESPSRIHRRTSRHVSNSDSVGVCSCGSAGIMQPCSSAIWSSRGIAEPRAPAEPPDCSALNVLGSFIAFLSARRRLSRRSQSFFFGWWLAYSAFEHRCHACFGVHATDTPCRLVALIRWVVAHVVAVASGTDSFDD